LAIENLAKVLINDAQFFQPVSPKHDL